MEHLTGYADAGGRAEDFFLHEDGNSGWSMERAQSLSGAGAEEKIEHPEPGKRFVRACAAVLLSAAMLFGAPEEAGALRKPLTVEQEFSSPAIVRQRPPGRGLPPHFRMHTGAVFIGTKAGPLSDGFREAVQRSEAEKDRHPRGRMRRAGVREACRGLAGLQLLKKVNDEWNGIGRWRSDMSVWGQMNRWATPEEFAELGGDCEDYALAKWATLRDLGWPDDRLWIACIDPKSIAGGKVKESHAVLFAQTEEGDLMALDVTTPANGGRTFYGIDRFTAMYGYPALLMTERRQWSGFRKDNGSKMDGGRQTAVRGRRMSPS